MDGGPVEMEAQSGGWGVGLPVVGEADAELLAAVSGGQPVILTVRGLPAAVVIDLDSYTEWAEASGLTP